MTSPAPGTAAVTTRNTNSTTNNQAMPTCSAGQLLICFNAVGGSSGPGTWGTTPAGWAKPLDRSDGTACRAGIFWKIADGSESGGTVNFPGSTSRAYAGICYAVDSWSGILADLVISTVATNLNPPDAPSLTSGYGSVDTTWFAAGYGSTNDTSISAPSGYSGFNNAEQSGTLVPQICTAWKQTTAASENPGAFTGWGSSTNQAWTVAIKPASAAGGISLLNKATMSGGMGNTLSGGMRN